MSETNTGLSATEARALERLVGLMIPASSEHGVPGADDPVIFADIVKSLGRDERAVRDALWTLNSNAGGSYADLPKDSAENVAQALLESNTPEVAALSRAVLQCYYRDDRVLLSLGIEPRPPFPKGHVVEQGDWSLLDAVRGRPKMWRDAP